MGTENVSSLAVIEFQRYFSGSANGYGLHTYKFTEDGQKEEGYNKTVKPTDPNGLVTLDLYSAHLDGLQGLGVIPVTTQGTCRFTVIDIDVYDKNLSMFVQGIERNNLPMLPFRSKSGGLHIYTFFREFVDSRGAVEFTRKLASVLTLDMYVRKLRNTAIEIFPKQFRITGDSTGSWINMPYYNVSDTRQYAIYKNRQLSFEEAMIRIQEIALNPRTVEREGMQTFFASLPYSDAPPCLQSMFMLDAVTEHGGRNNYLFSFGTYLKSKDEQRFEAELYDLNSSMSKPLVKGELEQTILSSLRKKDYGYRCTQSPCSEFCNKQECKTREYGVGKDMGYFSTIETGKLVQIRCREPYYEWAVRVQGQDEWKVLRFQTEDDIIKQDTFIRLCFRELHELPPKVKQTAWFKIVSQSLKEIDIQKLDGDYETSAQSILNTMTDDFLTKRSFAKTKEQLLSKRVFYDPVKLCYFFRMGDLVDFLYVTKGFNKMPMKEIGQWLNDIGCEKSIVRTEKGTQVRVVKMSEQILLQKVRSEFTPDATATTNEVIEDLSDEVGKQREFTDEELAIPDFKTEEPNY